MKIMHQFVTLLGLITSSTCLVDPEDRSHCTTHPTFTLHDISFSYEALYTTPDYMATAIGTINFSISNTAVNYISQCEALADAVAYPDFFYGNATYPCTAPASASPGASANFTFSRPEGKIQVTQTWSCGKGREKENFFGFGSGYFKLICNETDWTNPNWTEGKIYGSKSTSCLPAEVDITPEVSYDDY